MRMLFAPAAALVSAMVLFPVAATAAPLSFINNTIASRIPAKDLPAFKAAVAQALNETPDRASSEWTSSPGRGRQPVKVVFKPQQTAQTQSAGTCRLLAAEVSQLSTSENWRFWFCKQPNGSWKSSGSQLP
ncbi:hypothetical protein EC845_4025 [Comamonas sp. BIGb0124]|uniref:hypothetical protein n=1 Tax=Comamonas sp. BIGb0124 TaxID=2485130 RepID=UPI000F49B998|nr:hypothetical protein [Comamonas sp. BIGb0124]ROR16987.1 hypothetical protein EC845_4025 [Comamonas sp. BIGb0124]